MTSTHRSGAASRLAAMKHAREEREEAEEERSKRRSMRYSMRQSIRQSMRQRSVADAMRVDSVDEDEEQMGNEVDIERIAMRLDGFEMYAFLASLIAGFSFGCLNEFDALPAMQQRLPFYVSFPISLVFAFSLVASIFCGLYATCVFALCSLYSKTALAEQKDERSTCRSTASSPRLFSHRRRTTGV